MANEVIDIAALTVRPSDEAIEELKPEVRLCKDQGCTRPATRSDGCCSRHSLMRLTVAEKKRLAKRTLDEDQDRYARLHMIAAINAAAKGDATPAQWALLHGKTVEPLEKKGDTGITVNVGVMLPNN